MALGDSLVEYWKMDEASGNALAVISSSNDLTDNATVGSATGKIGNARDFELSNSEYFSHTGSTTFKRGNTDFTWRAWVKMESAGAKMAILCRGNGAGGRDYDLMFNSDQGTYSFECANGSMGAATASNYGPASTGVWHCVHAWGDWTNGLIGISVNASTANTSVHPALSSSDDAFNVGRRPTGVNLWDGLIDEIALWSRVLSSSERTEDYNSGTGRDYDYLTGGSVVIVPSLPRMIRQAVKRASSF